MVAQYCVSETAIAVQHFNLVLIKGNECRDEDWVAHRLACDFIRCWMLDASHSVQKAHVRIYRWLTCGAIFWEWITFQALRGRSATTHYLSLARQSTANNGVHRLFDINSIECVPRDREASHRDRVTFGRHELLEQAEKRQELFQGSSTVVDVVLEVGRVRYLYPVSLNDLRCSSYILERDDQWLLCVKRSFATLWSHSEYVVHEILPIEQEILR